LPEGEKVTGSNFRGKNRFSKLTWPLASERKRERKPAQQRQRVAWSNGERPQGDRASASPRLLPRRQTLNDRAWLRVFMNKKGDPRRSPLVSSGPASFCYGNAFKVSNASKAQSVLWRPSDDTDAHFDSVSTDDVAFHWVQILMRTARASGSQIRVFLVAQGNTRKAF
jgi:hypothetical protein